MSVATFVAPPVSSAADEAPAIFSEATLWAGDLVVDRKPARLVTVLGSCVSVCLYAPTQRFGGMNHYLVPRGGRTAIHGDWATQELIAQMCRLGSPKGELVAKIFGGGRPLKLAGEADAIGTENVRIARAVLAEHGIPIVAERVSHTAGLRLFFENWTGVVWLRAHAEAR
jgi:chemotaxis protein CheD